MQVTQQIFVAEEWAKKAREDLHAEVQSRNTAEKAAGVLRLERDFLNNKVKEAQKAHASAEAGLKTTTKQAKDLRQQLHLSEINLAIEKQMVSDLKAELSKAKEATRVAREVAEIAVIISYEHGVTDTDARLTEEVATVCRDYITVSWGVALDRAAVPANSNLRKVKNIFFPEDIREIPPEEPLPAKVTTSDSHILEAGEVPPVAKDKSPKDTLTIRDVVAQAKEAIPKPKTTVDQPEPPAPAKSSTQDQALGN